MQVCEEARFSALHQLWWKSKREHQTNKLRTVCEVATNCGETLPDTEWWKMFVKSVCIMRGNIPTMKDVDL